MPLFDTSQAGPAHAAWGFLAGSLHHREQALRALRDPGSLPQGGDEGEVLLEGYVWKMGGLRRNWTKRWFQLFEDRLQYRVRPVQAKQLQLCALISTARTLLLPLGDAR